MIYVNLVANGVERNNIFHSESRDNCNYAFVLLREMLIKLGIELNTPDCNTDKLVSFEIHIDIHETSLNVKKYLLLWETGAVNYKNNNLSKIKNYEKIFSWNDDLVEKFNFIKYNLPSPGYLNSFDVNKALKNNFVCLIAGNKFNRGWCLNELYSERVRIIEWYEKNHPTLFSLFGPDWDVKPKIILAGGGLLNLLLIKILPNRKNNLLVYKGMVQDKIKTLSTFRYSICYENVKDLNGYITEKILDCFVAHCVPVYYGSKNINIIVPESCYIDRRRFKSNEDLHLYLTSLTDSEYENYVISIKKFLKSENFYKFSSEYFVENIIKNILPDMLKS
jgi:hypothetical protein